jgi:hypothetical protein
MLDGVFERCNHFFDVRRQLATTLDVWPQRDWRGKHQCTIQANRIEIVVEIRPPTTMKRIARAPHTGPAVLPMSKTSPHPV